MTKVAAQVLTVYDMELDVLVSPELLQVVTN
jgi:hypothetical protein